MPYISKFGFQEKAGCLFLTAGLLFLVILNITLPGMIPYSELFAYLFLIPALLCLVTYSKIFKYTLIVVTVNIIFKFISYLMAFHFNEMLSSSWITFLIRIIDFVILLMICAAINQYACLVNNCELSEKCIYVNKLVIWLAVVVVIYTFRLNIIKLLHIKGIWATLVPGAFILAYIMMPVFTLLQLTGMVKALKQSLNIRSNIKM